MPSRSPRAAGSPGKPARETKAGRAKKARRARTAMFLPAGCALALAGWAVWCFGGASAPSTTVAVSVGGTIRVAYDPQRRVNPAVEGANSPWHPGFLAAITLAAATVGARRVRLHWSRPEPESAPRRPRRRS
ncbi:hypothetical protein ACFRJ7_04735 [Streptomyces sp. NPDC056747]|uniref:hypothetical protein n=1 Tax=Streptomyces sp. NPDC056747 TaxID=3345935 RepID=UPI003699D623